MKKATTLPDIKRLLMPRPVSRDELQDLFVETADARDPQASRRAKLLDRLDTTDNVKVLVFGHGGTGKSTELSKFAEENETRYTVVRLSALDESLLGQVRIEPLLVLTAESVLSGVREMGLDMPEKTLEDVYRWFSETFAYQEREVAGRLGVGASADTKESWWGGSWASGPS